jgi:hypothetical protein
MATQLLNADADLVISGSPFFLHATSLAWCGPTFEAGWPSSVVEKYW